MIALKSLQWPRIYLFIVSSARAFMLGMGMAQGLKRYFPHVDVDLHIGFFAILFILHWIIVMFYPSVCRGIVVAALFLNSAFALFGRLFIFEAYSGLPLQEVAWFGSVYTIVIDVVLICYLLYTGVLRGKKVKKPALKGA